MSSKALELVAEKPANRPDCPPVSGVPYCVSDPMTKAYDAMVTQPSAAARTMLDGFSIDSAVATEASVAAAIGATSFAIGGVGAKATEMTVGKGTAFVFQELVRTLAPRTELAGVVRATLNEPYTPNLLRAGAKAGAYGAAAGLAAYGVYKGYEYLTAPKD